MNVKSFVTAAALVLAVGFGVTSASAATRITFDGGGSLGAYIDKYQTAKQKGERFIIDGLCISACTFITGFIEKRNVCTTERGYLVFHSASYLYANGMRSHSEEGTRLMWRIYPKEVRQALIERGWDASDGQEQAELIYIEASRFYKPCPEVEHDFSGKTKPSVLSRESHDR
jgi:hypothetical protein